MLKKSKEPTFIGGKTESLFIFTDLVSKRLIFFFNLVNLIHKKLYFYQVGLFHTAKLKKLLLQRGNFF